MVKKIGSRSATLPYYIAKVAGETCRLTSPPRPTRYNGVSVILIGSIEGLLMGLLLHTASAVVPARY